MCIYVYRCVEMSEIALLCFALLCCVLFLYICVYMCIDVSKLQKSLCFALLCFALLCFALLCFCVYMCIYVYRCVEMKDIALLCFAPMLTCGGMSPPPLGIENTNDIHQDAACVGRS